VGFKLGTNRGNYMSGGEIKNKLRFHRESGDPDISVPGTPVIRKELAPGVMGEANMDGSIYISSEIQPGSDLERITLKHEMIHAKDMRISPNKLSYADDQIIYNGQVFARKQMNGKDMIDYNGKWVEAGSMTFPWEEDANGI
jgi:hypothetical protein